MRPLDPAAAPPRSDRVTVVLERFDDLRAGGLGQLLGSDPSLAVVARDVEHGRLSVVLRGHRPDVAILNLGRLSRPAEIRDLSIAHPSTRLVLLADELSGVECAQLLAFGASACLGRETQARDVLNAIHLASRGLQLLPRSLSRGGGAAFSGHLLTPRESEVLALLQQGSSNPQIARSLGVGVETVRTHARNIYRKLGVSSRRELIAQPTGARARQCAKGPRRALRRSGSRR
jgi:DNA-binding NarL/FixJ family response regulator